MRPGTLERKEMKGTNTFEIWVVMKEACYQHHMGYSFQLAARDLLYTPSNKQNNTKHDLCYASRRALGKK